MSDQGSFRLSPERAAERVAYSISLRKRREKRFLFLGKFAVAVALGFLVLLFAGILSKGIPGLFQHYVTLDVQLDAERLDPSGQRTIESLAGGDFDGVVRDALYEVLGGPTGRKAKRQARKLISSGSGQRLMHHVLDNPDQMGSTVALQFAVDDDVDTLVKQECAFRLLVLVREAQIFSAPVRHHDDFVHAFGLRGGNVSSQLGDAV